MSELTSLQEGPDTLHDALEASSAPHDVLDVSVEGIFVVRCSLGIPGSIVKSDNGLAELGVASYRRTAMLYIKRERGEGMYEDVHDDGVRGVREIGDCADLGVCGAHRRLA